MRIAIYTLGCKVNQCETQALETALSARDHTLVPFEAQADAYIVNTCTVTAASDKKCRIMIRHARKRSARAVVAVCGCYAQTDPQAIAALGADLVMGTTDRMAFLDAVEEIYQHSAAPEQRVPVFGVEDIMSHRAFESLPAGGLEGRTRAMLKVEDGCANYCSYCIIPYARGPVRSLPVETAAEQVVRLGAEGYREIILTGIEISSWGQDFRDGSSLIDLIEVLCAAVPDLRVRLGSLEPRTITPDFCRRAAALPNLCPHFHLSLQSGCDRILKAMNRKYDTARYAQSVALLREHYPRPAITTDLIVGFPGESEEDFAQSLAFVQSCSFSSMHVFPYSRRAGTPADKLAGQLSPDDKEARANIARALAGELEQEYLSGFVGTVLPVLFEDEKNGYWRGHAPSYVSVYGKGNSLHNVLRDVKITGLHGDGLMGEPL